MKTNRDFKGVWIEKEVWLDESLSLQEKVFYVEIDSLNNENGCFASNDYFAKFFNLSKNRVSLVIQSLIKKGKIKSTILQDEGNTRILETLTPETVIGSPTKIVDPLTQNGEHSNTVNNILNNTVRESTPAEKARIFFENGNEQNLVYKDLVAKGIPEQIALKEVVKFTSYWTEPNKSGTKQRWELEKTFELSRRLATWFRNYQGFNENKKVSAIQL